jgi:hypothetical protein
MTPTKPPAETDRFERFAHERVYVPERLAGLMLALTGQHPRYPAVSSPSRCAGSSAARRQADNSPKPGSVDRVRE